MSRDDDLDRKGDGMSADAATPPVRFGPLSRTDLVRYAGASGDFNPLHHDAAFATQAGLPDVMAHGMLSAGLLASAVTRWFGPGQVRSYKARFLAPVWPGDELVARCVSMTVEGDARELVLELARADGTAVVTAQARVAAGAEAGEDR
jgi:3-hydroxybutyryl-CoA dehydratase